MTDQTDDPSTDSATTATSSAESSADNAYDPLSDADVVLLDETDVDPEVADAAAEAVRLRARRRWVRRHDLDFEDGRP